MTLTFSAFMFSRFYLLVSVYVLKPVCDTHGKGANAVGKDKDSAVKKCPAEKNGRAFGVSIARCELKGFTWTLSEICD